MRKTEMISKIYQALDSMTLKSLRELRIEVVKKGYPESFTRATDIMIEKKQQR